MQIFLTGASGFIGQKVADQLLSNGHGVTALARSDETAKQLAGKGLKVVRGNLHSLEIAAEAAKASDGVVHLAITRDSDFVESCAVEQKFVAAINTSLAGTGKPFVATSSSAMAGDSGADSFTEDKPGFGPRAEASEATVLKGAGEGVRAMVLRLPLVYLEGPWTNLFGVTMFKALEQIAKEAGFVPYLASGQQKFSYVHVDDCAAAYLAALQHGKAGNIYHIGAPEPITTSELANAIAARLSSTEQEIPVKQVSKDDAARLFSNPIFIFFLSISSWMDVSKAQRELKWQVKSRKDLATAIVEAASE